MSPSRARSFAVFLVIIAAIVAPVGPANASVASRRLPTKSTEVKGVTVEASPLQVNDRGAVISIKLDTHSGDLDVDLRKRSALAVGGESWPAVSYRGDGPGGHHREGTLRFRSAGRATGSMRLVIKGLGGTAKFSWRLESN